MILILPTTCCYNVHVYIYMTLTSRYMTFCLTLYDSVSSGNQIIYEYIVSSAYNGRIWLYKL